MNVADGYFIANALGCSKERSVGLCTAHSCAAYVTYVHSRKLPVNASCICSL